MRRSYRDWIAWSLIAGIAVIAGTEYYVRQQTGMSTTDYVYKMVVTADRPAR